MESQPFYLTGQCVLWVGGPAEGELGPVPVRVLLSRGDPGPDVQRAAHFCSKSHPVAHDSQRGRPSDPVSR